jgi:hypothetical protein
MLLNVETPEAAQYLVHDCSGNIIPYVVSFDTETEEIEVMIKVKAKVELEVDYDPTKDLRLLMQRVDKEDGTVDAAPIVVKFKLPGAYALKNGNPIQ